LGQTFFFQNQWLLEDLANGFEAEGYSMRLTPAMNSQDEQIALANSKKTEIFRLAPASVQPGLDLNMFASETDEMYRKAQSYGVRSGFYSAAFLVQRILADKLDVDPTEIEIADIVMTILNDGAKRRTAEIVLTDELPNGSGFVRYLFENFASLMSEALSPSNASSYTGKIHSDRHQHSCSDACYDCLKVYRNMNYHSLLDWRLGLSILRVLSDSSYKCGIDNNFEPFIEIRGWLDFALESGNSFASSFALGECETLNGLPILKWGARKRNIVMITHPFWDLRNSNLDNWLGGVKSEISNYLEMSGGQLSIIDSFNLHRRPGWCYEKLINRQ
jgi:hypothetical protein